MAIIIAFIIALFALFAPYLPIASAQTTAVYLDRGSAAGRLSAHGEFYDETAKSDAYSRREMRKIQEYKDNYAPNIAVVITGSDRLLVEEKTRAAINDMMEIKFPWRSYNVKSDPSVYASLYEAMEEAMVEHAKEPLPQSVVVDYDKYRYDYNIGIGPYYKNTLDLNKLNKAHFIEAAQKGDADYLIILSFYTGRDKIYNSYWALRSESDVVLRARCLDVAKGEYLYFRDVVEEGKATSLHPFRGRGRYAKGRAYSRAAYNCLMAFFSDLPIGEKVSQKKLEELWQRQQEEREKEREKQQ